jgi:hypothetical protein
MKLALNKLAVGVINDRDEGPPLAIDPLTVRAIHLKEKTRIAVALAGWAWLTPLPPLVFNHANFFAPGAQGLAFYV